MAESKCSSINETRAAQWSQQSNLILLNKTNPKPSPFSRRKQFYKRTLSMDIPGYIKSEEIRPWQQRLATEDKRK